MKRIASQIKKANSAIQKRFAADVKRAKSAKACNKSVSGDLLTTTRALFKEVNERVNKQILQSVQVCNTDCLTVSFEREVLGIRKLLSKASSNSQKLAKKVVKCAPVRSSGNSAGAPRSGTDLNKILSDTHKIVTSCKICKH